MSSSYHSHLDKIRAQNYATIYQEYTNSINDNTNTNCSRIQQTHHQTPTHCHNQHTQHTQHTHNQHNHHNHHNHIGPTGPIGYRGHTGCRGPTGKVGYRGHTGQTGPSGPEGPTGYTGYTGPTLWTPTNSSDIAYTSGTTTVSTLYVQSTNYNRQPMGLMTQTQMGPTGSYVIQTGATFPTDASSNALIGQTPTFQTIGPTGPRKVRTHIQLNVEDMTNVSNGQQLFFSLYDASGVVLNRYVHTYHNALSTSLNYYNYETRPTNETNVYSLYGYATSSTATVSTNLGSYNSTNTAPPSYITIEDIGLS